MIYTLAEELFQAALEGSTRREAESGRKAPCYWEERGWELLAGAPTEACWRVRGEPKPQLGTVWAAPS